jgi:hypothetical protein
MQELPEFFFNFSSISFDQFVEKIQFILPDSIIFTDSDGRISISTNYFLSINDKVEYCQSTPIIQ